jgi:hypothetical protein
MLTATATAIITNCNGRTKFGGNMRCNMKIVEKIMVAQSTVKAVILVFFVNPLPSV